MAPVLEGAVQHIASRRFEIGGTDLTKLFSQELSKSNPSVNLSIYDAENLKEQYSCCAEDELANGKIQCKTEEHILPDGQVAALFTLVILIAVNLAVGILPHVDNFAHIGGRLTGFLLGFIWLICPQFGWFERKHLSVRTTSPTYK